MGSKPALVETDGGYRPGATVCGTRPRSAEQRPHAVACAVGWLAALAMVGPALAQTAPSAAASGDGDAWHVRATAMGYFPAVYGQTRFPGGHTGPGFHIDPHTILRNLNAGFMGELHAQKGRWGVLLHLRHTDISKHVRGTRDFTVPNIPIPVGVNADLGLSDKMTLMTLAGTYQAIDRPEHELQLLAGTRMLRDRQRLKYRLSAPVAGMARSGTLHARSTQWDAIVGVMGRQRLARAPHWFIPYYLDVGTGDSRFTMQASLGLGYAFRWGEISAAWRYIDYHYKSDSPVSRLRYTGPTVGVTWTF